MVWQYRIRHLRARALCADPSPPSLTPLRLPPHSLHTLHLRPVPFLQILAKIIAIKLSITKLAAATMGAPMTESPEQVRQKAAAAKARAKAMERKIKAAGLKPGTEPPEEGGLAGFVKSLFSKKKLDMVMVQMQMVPMFSILCVFMRLRAKVDMESEPQAYAKTAMQVATAAL